jgi:5-methylcytosine-specific restriction endonuclease McrA
MLSGRGPGGPWKAHGGDRLPSWLLHRTHILDKKTCKDCSADLPLTSFYRQTSGRTFARCKSCYNLRQWAKIKSDKDQYARRLERNRAFKKRHRADLNAANRAWYAANPETQRAAVRRWVKANPERWRAIMANRRGRESGGQITKERVSGLFTAQKGKCAVCAERLKAGYHIDHIVPLALGGPHSDENIQLLCPSCNTSKGAKHPVDFMQSRGFLI